MRTWETTHIPIPTELPHKTSDLMDAGISSFSGFERGADDKWEFVIYPATSNYWAKREILFTHDEQPPKGMAKAGKFTDEKLSPDPIYIHLADVVWPE